jgi:hypothetical protein
MKPADWIVGKSDFAARHGVTTTPGNQIKG